MENMKHVRKFGKYNLYLHHSGEYCLTDGWLCDWFIVYGDGLGWAHDGMFALRADIRAWFNKLSPRTVY